MENLTAIKEIKQFPSSSPSSSVCSLARSTTKHKKTRGEVDTQEEKTGEEEGVGEGGSKKRSKAAAAGVISVAGPFVLVG